MKKTPRSSPRLAALAGLSLLAACSGPGGDDGDDGDDDDPGDGSVLAGEVWIGGPVAGATVTVTQLDPDSADGAIKAEAGTTTTGADGRYELAIGELNGLFLVEARGGTYTELASGDVVELAPDAAIRSLHHVELFEGRTDALVSPVGHLTDAFARGYLADRRATTLDDAIAAVKPHLDDHFGDVDWERLRPASLATAATGATSEVRAALVVGAWSLYAGDLAALSGALPSDVNSYAVAVGWAADLAAGPFAAGAVGAFDGNDRNTPGGLAVGECEAPSGECSLECGCFALCDLHAGTPRGVLAAELVKLAGSAANQTGLDPAAITALADAIRDRDDALLFGDPCDEPVPPDDLLPPTIQFVGATPIDGALVRGTVEIRIAAVDDHDLVPVAGFAPPFADGDGDPTNAVAELELDTTELADGAVAVAATAVDDDGNTATASRGFEIDNTVPVLAVSPEGFTIRGTEWWTTAPAPTVRGTATDAHAVTVRAYVGPTEIGSAAVAGGAFTLALATGAIAATGTDVRFVATDAAGNAAEVTRRLRVDAIAPQLTVLESPVKTELGEAITFPVGTYEYVVRHDHTNPATDLALSAPPASCPTIYKHVHLLAPTTPYATEVGGAAGNRNPIQLNLSAVDDGIGIDLAGSSYRVTMASGAVVQGWTAMPAGETTGNATRYAIGLDTTLPALRATEGVYIVDLRIRDQFGRVTETARCWDHKLLGPPLKTTGARSMTTGMTRLALSSMTLVQPGATQSDEFAAAFMNADSKGASVSELEVSAGTELPTFLTVTLNAPSTLEIAQAFTIHTTQTNVSLVEYTCGEDGCGAVGLPPAAYNSAFGAPQPVVADMRIRVYALTATGAIGSEIGPCTAAQGCSTSGSTYEYLLPGRDVTAAHDQPPKRYLVATMTGPLFGLRPRDPAHEAAAPFADTAIGSVQITGKVGPAHRECLIQRIEPAHPPIDERYICTRSATLQDYRASRELQIGFGSASASTRYSSAARPEHAPASFTSQAIASGMRHFVEPALP
jgi:hypothetical protein